MNPKAGGTQPDFFFTKTDGGADISLSIALEVRGLTSDLKVVNQILLSRTLALKELT